MLEIFGWGPYRFGIFGTGLTSVENVDSPDQSPGIVHALRLYMYPVIRRRDVVLAK